MVLSGAADSFLLDKRPSLVYIRLGRILHHAAYISRFSVVQPPKSGCRRTYRYGKPSRKDPGAANGSCTLLYSCQYFLICCFLSAPRHTSHVIVNAFYHYRPFRLIEIENGTKCLFKLRFEAAQRRWQISAANSAHRIAASKSTRTTPSAGRCEDGDIWCAKSRHCLPHVDKL